MPEGDEIIHAFGKAKSSERKKNMRQGIALTAYPQFGAVFSAVIHLVDFQLNN